MSSSIVSYRPSAPGLSLGTNYLARNRDNMARFRNFLRASRGMRNRMRTRRSAPTMVRRRRTTRGGQGVTEQYDRRLIYKKKSMPKWRKKRWRRFSRKVDFVQEKDLGTRTVVYNYPITFGNSTSGFQGTAHMYLYGLSSSTSWANDMEHIISGENYEGNPTTGAGQGIEKSTRLFFHSAVLDITMRNGSTYNSGAGFELTSAAKLEVDVYEMSMKRSARTDSNTLQNLLDVLNDGNADTKAIGGSGIQISYDRRGSTPWDLTHALSRHGLRIWSKRKYMLSNQEVITYQVRDPKRHESSVQGLRDYEGFNKPGWTRIVYVVFKMVPGLPVGINENEFQEVLECGITRKYMYKCEGANDDRNNWSQV